MAIENDIIINGADLKNFNNNFNINSINLASAKGKTYLIKLMLEERVDDKDIMEAIRYFVLKRNCF